MRLLPWRILLNSIPGVCSHSAMESTPERNWSLLCVQRVVILDNLSRTPDRLWWGPPDTHCSTIHLETWKILVGLFQQLYLFTVQILRKIWRRPVVRSSRVIQRATHKWSTMPARNPLGDVRKREAPAAFQSGSPWRTISTGICTPLLVFISKSVL